MVDPVAATSGKVNEPVLTVTVGEPVMLFEAVGTSPETVSTAAASARRVEQNRTCRPSINARNLSAPNHLSQAGDSSLSSSKPTECNQSFTALVATFGPRNSKFLRQRRRVSTRMHTKDTKERVFYHRCITPSCTQEAEAVCGFRTGEKRRNRYEGSKFVMFCIDRNHRGLI